MLLPVGSVKTYITSFFESFNLPINLYIKYLSTACKVKTLPLFPKHVSKHVACACPPRELQ